MTEPRILFEQVEQDGVFLFGQRIGFDLVTSTKIAPGEYQFWPGPDIAFAKLIARARKELLAENVVTIQHSPRKTGLAVLVNICMQVVYHGIFGVNPEDLIPATIQEEAKNLIKIRLSNIFLPYDVHRMSKLSNSSRYSVSLPNLGRFNNADIAFKALRVAPDHLTQDLLNRLHGARSGREVDRILEKVPRRENWHEVKYQFMRQVIRAKAEQHSEIKAKLFNTKLQPIYTIMPKNTDWGVTEYHTGNNNLGKILTEIKLELLAEDS